VRVVGFTEGTHDGRPIQRADRWDDAGSVLGG